MRDETASGEATFSEFGTGRQAPVPAVRAGQGARVGAETDSSVTSPTDDGAAASHATPSVAAPVYPEDAFSYGFFAASLFWIAVYAVWWAL